MDSALEVLARVAEVHRLDVRLTPVEAGAAAGLLMVTRVGTERVVRWGE